MTNEMLYIFLGIVILIAIGLFIFRSRPMKIVQTKEEKREYNRKICRYNRNISRNTKFS